MARGLNIGSDVGYHKAFEKKSPRASHMCGSPLSQMSTAPSTPCNSRLLDADLPDMALTPSCLDGDFAESPLSRQHSNSIVEESEEDMRKCLETPIQSELGHWAQRQVEAKDVANCLGMPPLHSALGCWAQQGVEEEDLLGLRPMQSELGRWAKRLVEAEMWYQKQTKNQELYLVESSTLWDGTTGLAYRNSKRIDDRAIDVEGPVWGTTLHGIDQQDGWVKVEDLYLPMTLEGLRVLTPCSDTASQQSANAEPDAEPMCDGPALMEDGRVVDLEHGLPIFFGCDQRSAAGHVRKMVMMNAIKDVTKFQMAFDASRAAAEVDQGERCSIDAAGVLRGEECLSTASVTKDAAAAAAARLKLFGQKRSRRQSGKSSAGKKDAVVGINPDGKAFLFLYLADPAMNIKRRRYQEQTIAAAVGTQTVMSIDVDGVVQD